MQTHTPEPDEPILHDFYGGFPTTCPDGSQHAVMLGNTDIHGRAERMSYDFTVPLDAHEFSITYWYAVVFQDPGHPAVAQPRLEIQVTNLSTNDSLGCSSFSFIASAGCPVFISSRHDPNDPANTPIWCRDWSANNINLTGKEGQTFRLSFKTADCTPGGHFGYAYIDVSSHCSSSFTGASYCPADTAINLTAPPGYQGYTWYTPGFTQVLGTQQALHLSPPPPPGTNVFVEVSPYPGYGCIDTLKATLEDTLTVTANAGDTLYSCDRDSVQLGGPPVPGIIYKWTPANGLSNPDIANPYATVNTTTRFALRASSYGGGCFALDTATVIPTVLSDSIWVTGNRTYCTGSGAAPPVIHVFNADNIQWFNYDGPITGATDSDYTVLQSSGYLAEISAHGCRKFTDWEKFVVSPGPHASFRVNNPVQCSPLDTFAVRNLTTISAGTVQYQWNFGDGFVSNADSLSHIYSYPGNYNISLHASNAVCASDTTIAVIVKPGSDSKFSAKNICVNLPLPLINNVNAPGAPVVNYLWDFGDNQSSALKNPVHIYTAPGNYNITLFTSTPQCPAGSTKSQEVTVTVPAPNIRYADHPAIINYPEPVDARPIGITALWSPAIYLNNVHLYKPLFRSFADQQYNITLTTDAGCVTVDTVLVKVYKKIEIHVPTAFTPNGDGNNDVLKPLLFGFKKVNAFRVYDRWGKILFEAHDDLHGWDGTFKGMPLDIQTVIWVIDAVDVDGVTHFEKGTTTILR